MVRLFLAMAIACLTALPAAGAAPPPLEDYGRLPGVTLVSLSPSGARYAMVATVAGQRRVMVVGVDNKLLDEKILGPVKVHRLEWAGEDHVLIHSSATVELGVDFRQARSELASCIVLDLKSHHAHMVFGGKFQPRVAKTVVGSYGTAEIGGRWYGFFGAYSYNRTKDGYGDIKVDSDGRLYPDLYRVDLDTGDFELAAEGQPGIVDWLVSPVGEVVARTHYLRRTGDWRVVETKQGRTIAGGRAETGDVSLNGFGRTAGEVLIQTRLEENHAVQQVSLESGSAQSVFAAEAAGAELVDPTTRLWIGNWTPGDAGAPKLFDPVKQARVAGAYRAFPGYVVSLVSYSADFKHMVMFTEGGDDSGTYWLVDIDKRSAEPIGRPYPSIKAAHVGPVRWVDYKAADGLALQGVLTLPPGPARPGSPLVVMPHGGPAGRDTLQFDYMAQAFASRGYAVFQPNFRGSDGYGKAFHDAGFGEWGRKMQTDISDGVAELARQGLVDPKRVCIVGASYGGYAALAGVTVQNGFYKCAVAYGGMADLDGQLGYVRQRAGGGGPSVRAWKEMLGVASNEGVDLDAISPAALAARADAPILLIHGKDDTVVPYAQSAKMEKALRAAGKSVELLPLPGADHWLLQEPSRIAMLKASVDFVMRHNPPDAPPAP